MNVMGLNVKQAASESKNLQGYMVQMILVLFCKKFENINDTLWSSSLKITSIIIRIVSIMILYSSIGNSLRCAKIQAVISKIYANNIGHN